ncbi:1-acyl-sn-glycerol-3-phosphate acyltransferase [Amycolatopsis marina]|uniref:1-acyl-sn-glycerol-3-phosphate acyltransferase n=1 Tax=Amycolatopsis marina TaxID=490629 RepID=A0A1I0XEV4_9PSEU|nr:lysophospholipid acyltransferase family protein [Amycolatopsis marina]SFA99531.1 1-acyl-sn-glycerol-3-phosphate acyltransferase [Amycolatopsis marina]
MAKGTEAQIIPLRPPERGNGQHDRAGHDTPQLEPAPPGARRADAPVFAFPGSEEPEPSAGPEHAADVGPDGLPEGLSAALDFLRHRLTGDYTVDEFGFDRELTDTLLLPPLRLLYEKWFRVSTEGVANLPDTGGALVVCNHSGVLPLDSVMTAVAVHDEHPQHRHLRMLGADLVFRIPMVGALARKSGQTLACQPDAERLLRGTGDSGGELVGVWPEGFKGVGKPFSSRYKLQRFGRGGFVSAALRCGVPIIPCAIVGAEEIYPKIGDLKPLARLLGLPYFPVTPFFPLLGPLGAVPLPTKWHIEFGSPIRTDSFEPDAEEDPMLVFNLTDQVRESIQQMLYRGLAQRRSIFRG